MLHVYPRRNGSNRISRRTTKLVSSVSSLCRGFTRPYSSTLVSYSGTRFPSGFFPAFVPSSNQRCCCSWYAWSVNNRPCDREINSFFHRGSEIHLGADRRGWILRLHRGTMNSTRCLYMNSSGVSFQLSF